MKLSKEVYKGLITVVSHLVFWLIIYFIYTYFLGYGSNNTEYVNKFSIYLMPVTICVSYFFLYFLIPKYLLTKKQGLFLLYSVYTFIVSAFLIILSILYALVFLIELNSKGTPPLTKSLPFIILGVYFVVLMVIVFGLVLYNYKSIVKNEDLKNKFLQTQLQLKEQELKFLKMQIHPHFLFNSLNTIYGFALKKGDETPDMILKLSNLLDYILYQVKKPTVNLIEEINHINEYIELERIRFQDTLKVSFNSDIENESIQIPPMLLIPFVENAFKHGSIVNGILTIEIAIEQYKNEFNFSIKNTVKESVNNIEKGIGLETVKKRLDLLFNNDYELNIDESNDNFNVQLFIKNL
ncbi:sensor histidine kinase [Lutibacter aestuarii]|uniref:Sensor histidine kinase n=1 Tax=Lutibacter aestuarii TaxID=861111 RepID=A0ABW2Z3S8_9FLAO|nr:histidine kinase [uncultured Lutibacter sp.]